MFKNFFETIKDTKFYIIALLFVITYIFVLLFWEHKQEKYSEEIFKLEEIKPEMEMISTKIQVGLHINSFTVFSFDSNDFLMTGIIWFKFPIGGESLKTIQDFSFQNGEIKSKSDPIIKIIENDVLVSYQIKVEFKTNLNYKDFPLGDHRLSIILENQTITPNEIYFESDTKNFTISKNIITSVWKEKTKEVYTGFTKSELIKDDKNMQISYPCAVFNINFENNSLRDIITLYVPMFIIFFISLFTLLIGIEEYTSRLEIISQAMPGMVLFRLVIIQLAPSIGVITKLDFLYFSLIFLSLIILLFQAYVLLVMKKLNEYTDTSFIENKKQKLEIQSRALFILIVMILFILQTYNTFFK